MTSGTSRRFEDAPKAIKNLKRSIEELRQRTSRKGHGHALGYAEVTSDQTGIDGTIVDLTGLSVTVDVAANRRIKITGYAHFISVSSLDERGRLRIRDGTNSTLNFANSDFLHSSENQGEDLVVIAVITPASGSHTFKLSAERIAGGTAIEMDASSIHPAFILIEDIGPA